jgi:glutathione S-transferase
MMRLHYSAASQFVRKVMVTAIELGLDSKIELIVDKRDLKQHNPLLKRPALISEEGDFIIDSPVICGYLDSLAGHRLIPAAGGARWRALSLEALGDGIMDAVSAIRQERTFHPNAASKEWYERQMLKVSQGLDRLDYEVKREGLGRSLTIAEITAGVLCGYLDFAFAEYDWRAGRSRLAGWYDEMSTRESMSRTMPKRSQGET